MLVKYSENHYTKQTELPSTNEGLSSSSSLWYAMKFNSYLERLQRMYTPGHVDGGFSLAWEDSGRMTINSTP